MFKPMLKTSVYVIFPITFAISAPLKSVFNSCLIVLEPLTHKTAALNRLKHSFALNQRLQFAIEEEQLYAECGA